MTQRKSPLEKHRHHQIDVIEGPIGTNKPGLIHAGKLMCIKCNKLIKWATDEEVDLFKNRYAGTNIKVTYQGFVDRLHQPKQVKDTRVEYIWLTAQYKDRNEVHKLGAKFDWDHKLWYVSSSTPHLQHLKPWIHISDQIKLGLSSPIPIVKHHFPTTNNTDSKLKQLLEKMRNDKST